MALLLLVPAVWLMFRSWGRRLLLWVVGVPALMWAVAILVCTLNDLR